jgi:hypothetical protein
MPISGTSSSNSTRVTGGEGSSPVRVTGGEGSTVTPPRVTGGEHTTVTPPRVTGGEFGSTHSTTPHRVTGGEATTSFRVPVTFTPPNPFAWWMNANAALWSFWTSAFTARPSGGTTRVTGGE